MQDAGNTVNKGMQVFNQKFHPNTMLIVGTSGISYEEFLKINPAQVFDI